MLNAILLIFHSSSLILLSPHYAIFLIVFNFLQYFMDNIFAISCTWAIWKWRVVFSATIDVKKSIYDLAINRYDTQIAIVENSGVFNSVQESVVRVYDVGRRRDDEDEQVRKYAEFTEVGHGENLKEFLRVLQSAISRVWIVIFFTVINAGSVLTIYESNIVFCLKVSCYLYIFTFLL